MIISRVTLSNFQSFGADPTSIELTDTTFLIGPNGSGKTALLEALARVFGANRQMRRVLDSDFHVAPSSLNGDPEAQSRTLWIEVEITLEEAGSNAYHASVPPLFLHMRMESPQGPPRTRIRLTANLLEDGSVEEQAHYVIAADAEGTPSVVEAMPKRDRDYIEVHYLPAQRDPSEQIAFTASSIVGRTLRAADWGDARETLKSLSKDISNELSGNASIVSLSSDLTELWQSMHHGDFFKDPSISFNHSSLESIFRQLTLTFTPNHLSDPLSYSRLSDGQKSLLYISVILAWHKFSQEVLDGSNKGVSSAKLRPPIHTIIALEEPENSLAPQYLGRIVSALNSAANDGGAQSILATHSPSVLQRVDCRDIRFLRLNEHRETELRHILLPEDDDEAAKYIQEAVNAFPELYFSRFVVLGEGASELVILPRLLSATGVAPDDSSIAVVPLGGRHVNHLWRLLHGLNIPHLTLLDLDEGRNGGGWGRVRYAFKQLAAYAPERFATDFSQLPQWNSISGHPVTSPLCAELADLEDCNVFFSSPIDLDMMMMIFFQAEYNATLGTPTDEHISSVLGAKHSDTSQLDGTAVNLIEAYHDTFKLGSKPTAHISALAQLDDGLLIRNLPPVLSRLVDRVKEAIEVIPE